MMGSIKINITKSIVAHSKNLINYLSILIYLPYTLENYTNFDVTFVILKIGLYQTKLFQKCTFPGVSGFYFYEANKSSQNPQSCVTLTRLPPVRDDEGRESSLCYKISP